MVTSDAVRLYETLSVINENPSSSDVAVTAIATRTGSINWRESFERNRKMWL